VSLCDLSTRVTEQVAGPFNADFVATDFAAKIMFGKPSSDVRFLKPAATYVSVLVSPWRHCDRVLGCRWFARK